MRQSQEVSYFPWRPWHLSLTVVATTRSAALTSRLLAHLHVVASSRRRVAVLNGAEEFSAADTLTGLSNVTDATFLYPRRHAWRVVQHVVRCTTLVNGREECVARTEELRIVRV